MAYRAVQGYRHLARKGIHCSKCREGKHGSCMSIHCTCPTCTARFMGLPVND